MLSKIKKTKKWWGTSKKFEGSAIIVTFFVMMLILTTALSLALVTMKDMKSSIGASKSNLAYQAADEGVEIIMKDILDKMSIHSKINQLSNNVYCQVGGAYIGLIKNDIKGYIVELSDEEDNRIDCNNSTDDVSKIKFIKSIGVSKDNAQMSERAVKVPVRCPSVGCPP